MKIRVRNFVSLHSYTQSIICNSSVTPDPYENFVQGDASAFALMADWSTVFTKWQFVTPADNTDYVTTTFTDLTR